MVFSKTQHRLFMAALIFCVFLATVPRFFDNYRIVAFDTVPRDDYAPYLLHFLGDSGGEIPGAPFVYRSLSVIAAIPLYYLPSYRFSELGDAISATYLQATQALCLVNYVAQVLTTIMLYLIAHRRDGATPISAAVVALVGWLFLGFTAAAGVDAMAILVVSLLVYFQNEPRVFIPILLVSGGVNEKIPIILFAFVGTRSLLGSIQSRSFKLRAVDWRLVTCIFSLVIDAVMIFGLRTSGNENQLNPASWLANIRSSVMATFTAKGLVLNILPIVALVLLTTLASSAPKSNTQTRNKFSVAEWMPLIVLTALSLLADVQFNIG